MTRQRRGGRRTDVPIDVQSVRADANGVDVGAQFTKHARRHLIGRTVRAVQRNLQPLELQFARHRTLAELHVARPGIVDAGRLAEPFRADGEKRLVDGGLDLGFSGVVEFFTLRGEQLDAVVLVRIVRCRNHYPGIGPERSNQLGHRRRRQRPQHAHIGPGGDETRFERRLEQIAGNARVLADQHGRMFRAIGGQHAPQGIAYPHHEFGIDHAFADTAANAVGTEVFPAHGADAVSAAGCGCRVSMAISVPRRWRIWRRSTIWSNAP